MSQVTIKFQPYFKEPMLSGVKVCTARTKRMGEVLDTFEAFGAMFLLKSVSEESLHVVSDLWMQEGCKSREHFIEVWKTIHPRVGYRPKQHVFLHRFKKVTP